MQASREKATNRAGEFDRVSRANVNQITLTQPVADQEICRRAKASIANAEKDASGFPADGSITNDEQFDTGKMSALKTSGPPGTGRVLPVLRHVKYEHFVAGISGGVVSTLMLHPLDLIKTRFAGTQRFI